MATDLVSDPACDPHRSVQLRVARPTDRFDDVCAFYGGALSLPRIGGFEGHAGYTGAMFGVPGTGTHLEFTTHEDGSPCPAPTEDNLLVLYFANVADQQAAVDRLASAGHRAVPPENVYWSDHGGVTVEDPDGWRVVLMPAPEF